MNCTGRLASLDDEIKENEEKIESNSGGYKTESEKMKIRIVKRYRKN